MKLLLSLLFLCGLTAAGLYFANPERKQSSEADILQLADFAYQEKRYEDAFEWYQAAADQGLSRANFRLSQLYQLGEGTENDDELAAYWMERAAQQGLAEAEFAYAEILESGRGVSRSNKKTIASWYQKSALQGHPKAMLKLAQLYFGGIGLNQDTHQAFTWVLKAEHKQVVGATALREQITTQINNKANKGQVDPQFMMALIYINGHGVKKDLHLGETWLRKAAKQGHAEAQYQLGTLLVQKGEPENGLYWLNHAANQGHVQAGYHSIPLFSLQNSSPTTAKTSWRWLYHGMKYNEPSVLYNLATSLNEGKLGLPTSQFNYMTWLELAARGHITAAQNDFAVHLKLDQNDTKKSIQWFKKAAQTDEKSQFNLGFIYARGEGVTPQDKQAIYWWMLAEKNGNSHAKLMLGLLHNLGRGVGRSEQEALNWYLQAAKLGDTTAIYNIAMLYYNGKGINQNYAQAAKYIAILAKQGDSEAQNLYASLFLEGMGVKYAPKTAIYWFQKAATANNVKAMFNLAGQYRSGTGVSQNDKKAFYWYKKSADLNFAPAQNAVGYMYAEGRGIKTNKDLAEDWFQKAADNGLSVAANNSNALNKRGSFSLIRLQIDTNIRSDILTSKKDDLSQWLETHGTLVF